MKRVFVILMTAVTLFIFGSSSASAQSGAPAGNAANGKNVYMKAGCYSCHGTVGQGGPGGRLAPNPIPASAFSNYVRNGKLNNPAASRYWNGMPTFSNRFVSDSELVDLYAYLASIPAPPPVKSIPLLNE